MMSMPLSMECAVGGGPPVPILLPYVPAHFLPLGFTIPQNRLASLTNKCHGEEDLEYYIMEAGHILGLKLQENANAKVRAGRRPGPAGPSRSRLWRGMVPCRRGRGTPG